jgi:hypothetical protein
MKALMATMLLTAVLLAGCSSIETGASSTTSEQALCEQALCEQPRGGGVWAAAAGACIRGGGAM